MQLQLWCNVVGVVAVAVVVAVSLAAVVAAVAAVAICCGPGVLFLYVDV